MKTSVRVLIYMIENSGKRISIRGLSKDLKIDYKNVYTIVKILCKDQLISLERFGNTFQCVLNKISHPLIFEAEYSRREKLLKNKEFKILHGKLEKLPFTFITLLFGSYAKGCASKNSDIDLLFICEGSREKEIESVISLLPLKIHMTTLKYEDFLGMVKSREFSVASEAVKNNIILVGIEDYYRLMENAG